MLVFIAGRVQRSMVLMFQWVEGCELGGSLPV